MKKFITSILAIIIATSFVACTATMPTAESIGLCDITVALDTEIDYFSSLTYDDTISIQINDSDVDTSAVGVYDFEYVVTANADTYSAAYTVTVIDIADYVTGITDIISPVDTEIDYLSDLEYTDVDVTASTDTDISVPGVYTVTYTISSVYGVTEVTASVTIEDAIVEVIEEDVEETEEDVIEEEVVETTPTATPSSSTSSSSTPTPTATPSSSSSTTSSHTHSWTTVVDVAAYSEEVLVTAAYTEEILVQDAVYEEITLYYTFAADGYVAYTADEAKVHGFELLAAGEFSNYSATRENQLVSAAVYETVSYPAVYETVYHEAVTHQECSCGATK